jgi:hypothetical protein
MYRLSEEDEAQLRSDWEELAGLIGRGHVESLTGHIGRFLQIRPKAAHSRARRLGFDAEGVPFQIFYGVSGNARTFWSITNAREVIGYAPEDDSEIEFADEIAQMIRRESAPQS